MPRLATDTQLSSFGARRYPQRLRTGKFTAGVNCEVQCEQRYGGLYADGNGTLADTSQTWWHNGAYLNYSVALLLQGAPFPFNPKPDLT